MLTVETMMNQDKVLQQNDKIKYIVVTGGVISGVGKGIIASSTGLLMRVLGYRVTAIKIDPYLNIDAGTLSPFDHGEVYTLDDGGEVDLDLGNYERFLGITLTKDHNLTTGKVYQEVIEKERKGEYLGKTVQVVPHLTNAIQDWIERTSKIVVSEGIPEICIVEVGGTVGDIESASFIEAMRQFQFRVGKDNFCLIHVSLIPSVGSNGEQKTKPTQNSVRDLRGLGLSPDIIACRSNLPLEEGAKEKIAMFCHVLPEHVVTVHDCSNVMHVPLLLKAQGLQDFLSVRLNLSPKHCTTNLLADWTVIAHKLDHLEGQLKVALVGKYTHLHDSYLSIVKALNHASVRCNIKVLINWIEATDLEEGNDDSWKKLKSSDAIVIPGGFGNRGAEGKMSAINYARLHNIPILGLCLGFQLAVIEYARNVCGMNGANSVELDQETKYPMVIFMPEVSKTHMGGSMRLGSRPTVIQETKSKAHALYSQFGSIDENDIIHERHRHRYEINPEYVPQLESAGLKFVGRDVSGTRMEILELDEHPYFVATQFHPEFKSRVMNPSPLFIGLLQAAMTRRA